VTAVDFRAKTRELSRLRAELDRRDNLIDPSTEQIQVGNSLKEIAHQLDLDLRDAELARLRDEILLTLDVVHGLCEMAGMRRGRGASLDPFVLTGPAADLLVEERDRLVVLRKRERILASQLYDRGFAYMTTPPRGAT
jgi:hypothetical protein